ncbi:DUF397 domain-containing protein [Phytomonospora endophytica]|uniref:DUF397 domain-containing protein n=1 Tax=Phytomonospora endophytica TaxID=714109 RepID=A0A841FIG3_9ACTN|nr:DUF397 domain-containing protein [Phytomonospora endophytica]MBB6032927.1 hypothetical protein [Phytomonospora endophytica]GIG65153.1 hypothetical protein Pen01_14480 [Phytomonospora endophytica]
MTTPHPRQLWRKSSYSPNGDGNCVELAPTSTLVAVRDTKDRTGPVLTTSHAEWAGFVGGLRRGDFDA